MFHLRDRRAEGVAVGVGMGVTSITGVSATTGSSKTEGDGARGAGAWGCWLVEGPKEKAGSKKEAKTPRRMPKRISANQTSGDRLDERSDWGDLRLRVVGGRSGGVGEAGS